MEGMSLVVAPRLRWIAAIALAVLVALPAAAQAPASAAAGQPGGLRSELAHHRGLVHHLDGGVSLDRVGEQAAFSHRGSTDAW